MVGEHHQVNGHEFEQTLGDSEGQGSPTCCGSQGHRDLDMAQQLNNNKIPLNILVSLSTHISKEKKIFFNSKSFLL